jgi:hypothetical protein
MHIKIRNGGEKRHQYLLKWEVALIMEKFYRKRGRFKKNIVTKMPEK